jgi:hypothetical protein
MIPGRFRKEICSTRLSTEAETPMLMVDEPEPAPAICAAIFNLAHKPLRYFGGGFAPPWNALLRLSSVGPKTGLVALG